MNVRHFLALALLATAATARPVDEDRIIRDAELRAYQERFEREKGQMNERKLDPKAVAEQWAMLAAAKVSEREAAIRRYMYGYVLAWFGRIDDARAQFERARRDWPEFPALYIQFVRLAMQAENAPAAKAALKKALALDPEYVPALLWMASIAEFERELLEAKRLYDRVVRCSDEIPPEALAGLALINVRLYRDSYHEKRRARYKKEAINAARMLLILHPDRGGTHLFQARVYIDLAMYGEAIRYLEGAYVGDLDDDTRTKSLRYLLGLYQVSGDVKKVIDTLERLLGRKELAPDERASYAAQLEQARKNGRIAFTLWQVEGLLKTLRNPGAESADRQVALRQLLRFLVQADSDGLPDVARKQAETLRAVVRTLLDADAALAIEILRFFQTMLPDPRLARVLVHFVYPASNERITPAVRVEAARTLAQVAKIAAVPTLLHCLKDDSGRVVRAVDTELSRLCQVRSVAPDGVKPLETADIAAVRRFWDGYVRSDEGATRLLEAVRALRELVGVDATSNRALRRNPIADHIAFVILLDNGVDFAVWAEAYSFLTAYLGKDFRPIGEREGPVTPQQRAAAVRALDEFYQGGAQTGLEEEDDAGGETGDR